MRSSSAVCGLIGLLILGACAPSSVQAPPETVQPDPSLAEGEGVKVGLLLPLSGPAASLGQDMLDAAQMALFDVGENDLVLLPRDTAGSAATARNVAQQLIGDGVSLILGPLYSQAVEAVGPIAATAEVPVLAFSNVTSAARPPTTFILGFRPEEQVQRVVDFALAQGIGTISGLGPDDPYGRTALSALQEAVITGGGNLGETLLYDAAAADPSPTVRQLAAYEQRQAALEQEKARVAAQPGGEAAARQLETLDTFGPLPFDSVLLADFGSRLRTVAALLTFFDVTPADARFLGTMRWQDDPAVLQEDALAGGWFAAPDPDQVRAFEDRFSRAYGRRPQQLASLAYDATALAALVARDLNDPSFTIPTLTQTQGFDGATGLFRLRPDGLADHGLAVLELQGGRAVEVDPAPRRFDDRVVRRETAPQSDMFPPGGTGFAPADPGGGAPVETPGGDLGRVVVPERAPPPPLATEAPSGSSF